MNAYLTDIDKAKLKKLNLFGFGNDWFTALYLICLFIFIYSFFMPYFGWRHKPLNPPRDFMEYIKQVTKSNLIGFPFYAFAISNFLIKRKEIKNQIKVIRFATVKYKYRFFFKRRLIVFDPFLLIISKRPLQYYDLNEGVAVRMELTCFGRLLNYTTEKNSVHNSKAE